MEEAERSDPDLEKPDPEILTPQIAPGFELAWIIHDPSTAAHQRQKAFFLLLDDALHRLRGSNLAF